MWLTSLNENEEFESKSSASMKIKFQNEILKDIEQKSKLLNELIIFGIKNKLLNGYFIFVNICTQICLLDGNLIFLN